MQLPVVFDDAVRQVLEEYEARAAREAERMDGLSGEAFDEAIDEFLLPIGPATGTLLHLLIQESRATRILEVGASYGYSTLWLADAARRTGGTVWSLELHEGKQAHAREQIERAGLAAHVEFVLGDAQQSIERLEGPFDFVLLDIWKSLYIPCFDRFYPKLAPGALVAADNMLYPEGAREKAAAYQAHARSRPGIESVLLPVGSGIELSRFTG